MSEFDAEAERERLQEKYGEGEDREATERMSELLLKGATMTNAHCSDCGDPIFRYDGQEFCPTCQKPVQRDDDAAEAAAEDAESADDPDAPDAPAHVEVTDPDDDARVQFGGDAPTADDEAAPSRSPPSASDLAADAEGTSAEPASRAPAAGERSDDVTAAVGAARADLAVTLQRFAQAARHAEDPAAARDHLAAAREAAATLDELD